MNRLDPGRETRPVLVIGGGVAGQRAALDLVGCGLRVILLECSPSLGGTVAQLGTMFPLHNCLLCRGGDRHGPGCTRPTISPDLLDFARPDTLELWTQAQVLAVEGELGAFKVTIQRQPRYVDISLCINCDRCAEICPQELSDSFEAGLIWRKAAHRPAVRAVPDAYVIDKGDCCDACGRCAGVCPTGAIHLDQTATVEIVTVSAIVVATGMQLYNAARSQEYGYGKFPNVFTGLEMERMTSPAGPGEGRILRRSDGRAPERIAWLQCVGSREEAHDYCSSFCCGYATRQAILARQIEPRSEAVIYIMDDRVFAHSFNATYDPLRDEYGVRLSRNRPSVLTQDPATHDLLIQLAGDDGHMIEERFGMLVLSTGAEGAKEADELARILGLETDRHRFLRTSDLSPADTSREGIFVAGAASGPGDITDSISGASAASARVLQALRYPRSKHVVSERPARAAGRECEPRLGVVVCDCAGEIGGVIDLAETLGYVASLPGIRCSQTVPFGCLTDGLETMRRLIAQENLTGVVVGACNRRTYAPLFERELAVGVEFVSLREECSYVHGDDPEGATRKAKELLRMGVERLCSRPSTEHPTLELVGTAMVVGGGLAGLTAALHLAAGGIPVHLVEREAALGGNALRLGRTDSGEDVVGYLLALIARAQSHPQITVHTSTEVTRRTGRQGAFVAALVSDAPDRAVERQLTVGAIVVATGGEEYRGSVYGLGASERVLTLLDLEQRLEGDPNLLAQLKQVTFISCVGPWSELNSNRAWRCSRTCCETIIRQATRIKQANPSCQVVVLSREVNAYGFREERYTAARRAGVLFVRYDPGKGPRVETTPWSPLRVTAEDMSLQETVELYPDLLVLGVAILPRAEAVDTARQLGVPQIGEGFYREWESKTRSFCSLEPGIYLCGLAQGPKPSGETIAQALAAGNQALSYLLHERVTLHGTVAEVDRRRCMACLTCVRVCPYGVPDISTEHEGSGQGKAASHIDPARCQGCGTCVAECPAKAIELNAYCDEELMRTRLLGQWLVPSIPSRA